MTTTNRPSMFPRPASHSAPVPPVRKSTTKASGRIRAVPVAPIETSAVVSAQWQRPERMGPVKEWPSEHQTLPNAALRSALFTCTRPEKLIAPAVAVVDEYAPRVVNMVVERRIPSMPQYKIMYRGEILNQADAEVWQMAVHDARKAAMIGVPVDFSLNAWCRTLNRTVNDPRTNQSIINSMTRLQGAVLIVDDQEQGTVDTVNLIERFWRDTKTGRCTYTIHPKLGQYLRHDATEVDLWRKARLRTALAKWMHDFYSTHSDPIPLPLAQLHTLSGSNSEMRNFRPRVREAIEELQACDPPLFANETRVENDRLFAVKATNSYFEKPLEVTTTDVVAETVEEDDTRSAAAKRAAYLRSRVAL